MKFLLLLLTVSGALCYKAPVSGSGSYNLPSIGKYPAPQTTFPRDRGLPDPYKHSRMFRSVGSQVPEAESAFEAPAEELYRPARAVAQEEPSFVYDQAEVLRQRRSSGVKVIYPTFRTPIKQKPKIMTA